MRKLILLLFTALLLCSTAFSQDNTWSIDKDDEKFKNSEYKAEYEALIDNLQNREWQNVIDLVPRLIKAFPDHPPFHYYQGYAYKELFKKEKDPKQKHKLRNLAVESLDYFYQKGKGEVDADYLDNTQKILSYLATTYYNNIANVLGEQPCRQNCLEKAQDLNAELSEVMTKIEEPSDILINGQLNIELTIAVKYNQWADETGSKYALEKAPLVFKSVIEKYPDNAAANHYLGAFHFKRGLEKKEALNPNLSKQVLDKKKQEAIDEFDLATPYLKKACELDANLCYYFQRIEGLKKQIEDM